MSQDHDGSKNVSIPWKSDISSDDTDLRRIQKRTIDFILHEQYDYIGIINFGEETIEFISRRPSVDYVRLNSAVSCGTWIAYIGESVVAPECRDDYFRNVSISRIGQYLQHDGSYAFSFKQQTAVPGEYTLKLLQYSWLDESAGLALVLKSDITRISEILRRDVQVSGNDPQTRGSKERLSGKILLADHNLTTAMMEERIIRSFGLAVETVNDGLETVTRFRDSRPEEYDIIMMDLNMPLLNGYGAAESIRSLGRPDAAKICILGMAEYPFGEADDRWLRVGMNGRAFKPLDPELLYIMLRDALRQRRGQ